MGYSPGGSPKNLHNYISIFTAYQFYSLFIASTHRLFRIVLTCIDIMSVSKRFTVNKLFVGCLVLGVLYESSAQDGKIKEKWEREITIIYRTHNCVLFHDLQ